MKHTIFFSPNRMQVVPIKLVYPVLKTILCMCCSFYCGIVFWLASETGQPDLLLKDPLVGIKVEKC